MTVSAYRPGDAIRVIARVAGGPNFWGYTGYVVSDDPDTLDKMARLFDEPVLRVSLEQTMSEHYLPVRILQSNEPPTVRKARR